VLGRFDINPHSHHDVRPLCRDGFPAGGVYYHFEPSRFDIPHFPHHDSRPTHSNCEVQRIVKTSSGHMVKCWIPKIFLTNPSTEPDLLSLYVGDGWRLGEQVADGVRLLMIHDR
jgi:hypothetical protein